MSREKWQWSWPACIDNIDNNGIGTQAACTYCLSTWHRMYWKVTCNNCAPTLWCKVNTQWIHDLVCLFCPKCSTYASPLQHCGMQWLTADCKFLWICFRNFSVLSYGCRYIATILMQKYCHHMSVDILSPYISRYTVHIWLKIFFYLFINTFILGGLVTKNVLSSDILSSYVCRYSHHMSVGILSAYVYRHIVTMSTDICSPYVCRYIVHIYVQIYCHHVCRYSYRRSADILSTYFIV